MLHGRLRIPAAAFSILGGSCVLLGQGPPPDYDFDFVTIDHPGNIAYDGPSPFGPPIAVGRGRVDYVYRIARTEVTTSQWLEFVNTFTMRDDPSVGLQLLPTFWGARQDPGYSGPGYRWVLRTDVSDAAILPVSYISWRDSAMFCNWLHNDKSADVTSLATGAYDTATWGDKPPVFTDAPSHLPDARFWIPTLDEWMKAAHYDPNKSGPGQGGYWLYANSSDKPQVSGPPGIGDTSAGYIPDEPFAEWNIPLGAYPGSTSPWGLLDTSGGAREWTEEVLWPDFQYNRVEAGSFAGSPAFPDIDHISFFGSEHPGGATAMGLRIAANVPTPATIAAAAVSWCVANARRRRPL